ncbi:MAG: heme exporter protein CcmB [Bacteroidota bacterium]|nr:heme exporter protein CcmB [Bacteroidota bacterium]
MIKQIGALLYKDFTIEWRNRYALNGILLYLAGAVFICYLSFNVKKGIIHPITWNALFWIIILFSAINAISKSFSGEREGRNLYYFMLCRTEAIIFSKIIYNSVLLLMLAVIGFVFYGVVMGNPIQDQVTFFLCLVLSSIAFASSLSFVAAIASKASNNGTLMAILSFPIILPLLLLIIKISKQAIDGIDVYESYDELTILMAINVLVLALSYILFPYIWRN